MGNCIRHESPMQWGGDDWGPIFTDDLVPVPESVPKNTAATTEATAETEEEGMLLERRGSFERSDDGPKATKVKIKITKKQLEELLGRVDVKEMTVHQVLAQLLGGGAASEMHHQGWRPALQSIPETN